VLLKGENPPKLQYIELEHLNSLAGSQDQPNLNWKMQGISFVADVFIIDLSNCEMVLGIQ